MIGRYPAASHAFIEREISALRARGAEIETISIRPPHAEELITDSDREAADSTFTVLPAGPLKLLGAHLAALGRRPARYFGTLAHALRLGRGPRGRLWQLFYFAEAVVVWRRCRELGIEHIHTHFADTGTDSALLATRLEPGLTFSITVHGPDEFAEATDNRLAEKLERALFVVAVSADARGKAVEAAGWDIDEKISVVRLGVDVGRFAPTAGGATANPDPVGVLCVGRLVERKDQAALLEAIVGSDVRLTLAGDGPEREGLEGLAKRLGISDRVEFTGVVGQDEVLDLYRGADVFCLPSRSEGLPAVLIEAMACGLPVVATRIDAVGELVSDSEDGLLVEPGDSGALGAALQRLAADPGLRARLGEAGRETVRDRHDLDRQAAQLYELFGSANSSSGASMKRGGNDSSTSSL